MKYTFKLYKSEIAEGFFHYKNKTLNRKKRVRKAVDRQKEGAILKM